VKKRPGIEFDARPYDRNSGSKLSFFAI